MPASDSFSLEVGIFTVSCIAVWALRIRVSMSAMGSVIVMSAALPSPARLGHAGDLPRMDHDAQADPAQPEFLEHGLGSPTAPAPRVTTDLELGRALLLLDQCLLGHRVRCSPAA